MYSNSLGGGGNEIITLQIGTFANFAGTHFWNEVEEQFSRFQLSQHGSLSNSRETDAVSKTCIDHSVLFKVGQKQIWPRAVLVDFKNNLGALTPSHKAGISDESDIPSTLWSGEVEIYRTHSNPKSSFLKWLESNEHVIEANELEEEITEEILLPDVEQEVKTWSDYSKVYWHENSIKSINRYGNDQDFDIFTHGEDVLQDEKNLDEIMDSIRYFMEESDQIQGFHCLIDVNSGFASIAKRVLEELKDEASSTIIGFGLQSTVSPTTISGNAFKNEKRTKINQAISLAKFSQLCSMYIPLELDGFKLKSPFVQSFKPSSRFHTSAVIATFCDTVSSPYRCTSQISQSKSVHRMTDVVDAVCTTSDNTIANGSICLPFNESFVENGVLSPKWDDFNVEYPASASKSAIYGSFFSMRSDLEVPINDLLQKFSETTSLEEGKLAVFDITQESVAIPVTYPRIFSSKLDTRGELLPQGVSRRPPMSISCLTSIKASTNKTGMMIRHANNSFKESNTYVTSKFAKGEGGLTVDDMAEIQDRLQTLESAYIPTD